MCHIVLLFPLLALPIFWLAPLSIALPVYGAIFIVSIVIYIFTIRAMRLPVVTGPEALPHQVGTVLDQGPYQYRVQLHNEIWRARSEESLQPGDSIEVIAVESTILEVRKISEIKQKLS